MKFTFFRFLLSTVLLTFLPKLFYGQEILQDKVFNKNIYTVLFGIKGVEISNPAIPLNGFAQLSLTFDEIGELNSNLSYKIIHCNADWSQSTLRPQEYFDGFWKEPITNYDYSFNTLVPYTHFSVVLPRQGQKFKRSGNYLIQVFNSDDEKEIFFQARFIVYEELLSMQVDVKQPDRMSIRNSFQEVDVFAFHNNFPFNNVRQEVNLCIIQNGNWASAIYQLKPRFIKPGELDFNYDTINTFPGGNEYRYFDLRDLSYNSERVYKIDKDKNPIYAQLYRDKSRMHVNYTLYGDLNGRAVIDNRIGTSPAFDSDYLEVLFSFEADYPINEAEFYIDGRWLRSSKDERFKLRYNKKFGQYQVKALVKQGFYNYRHQIFEANKAPQPYQEGSYWQTENEYQIILYYRGISDESDRIIGYQLTNSVQE